ncbi:MAG: uroporphyrinogen decarboxylase, partial [Betaproteobacteria bacterium]|nr:uroporphyrinogen decarboxylase [Betaproteobacteria bacterium]
GKLAAHTLAWQRAWDFDLVKFMPSGTYGIEDWGAKTAYEGAENGARVVKQVGLSRPEDWRCLPKLDVRKGVYGAQNAALAAAAKELKGSAPILQTVFSPLTTARKLAGEAALQHLRQHSDALEAGLKTITEVTIAFGEEALKAGAHGFFFATQLATADVLAPSQYERFGKRWDLEFFDAFKGRTRVDMLHLHGMNPMFDELAGYPVGLVNWHDRLTTPTLGMAAGRFKGALVGGVEELGLLVKGSQAEVRAQVRDAISQTGGRRLLVGPGCVAGIAAPELNIRAVIDEARKAP